jgi:hypothetical protein
MDLVYTVEHVVTLAQESSVGDQPHPRSGYLPNDIDDFVQPGVKQRLSAQQLDERNVIVRP